MTELIDKKPKTILIVDDEPDIRDLVALTLNEMGLRSDTAATMDEARQLLLRRHFDVVLCDMRLPDGDGINLIEWMQEQAPDTPSALITAYGNAELAFQALKAGAFDFISKPVAVERLRKLVSSALEIDNAAATLQSDRLSGESAPMAALRSMISKVARSQAPVHISGESGTGKELVARLIHASGPRANEPFVPVNCGAIPSELMESELFGHRRGSFTGADQDNPGLIAMAEGGTLFLDEIAELPLHMQVKLLRVIQEKAVRPVGDTRERSIDVRILSATHQDLPSLVNQGLFRKDLYYRLDVINLHVPALRERRSDIPELAQEVLIKLAQNNGRRPPRLDRSAIEILMQYDFPGNVRELENVLERALALAPGDVIKADDIRLRRVPHNPAAERATDSDESLASVLDHVERQAIQKALRETGGNKTKAAKRLGMTFRQLRYRIAKLGLD